MTTFQQVIEHMQTTCRYCELYIQPDENGVYVDDTDGDGCSGDDECVNENQSHVPVLDYRTDLHWVICGRCKGEGTLGGYPGVYTEDDFAEDPDFFEDYMSHRRSCEDCDGTGKTLEITEEALERPEVQEWLDDWRDSEATYRMERMMGA